MPLRGVINGQTIIACQVPEQQWQSLKGRRDKQVIMPCCGSRGILKTSKLGTQFFAHFPKDPHYENCHAKGETLEHLQLKAEILKICQKLGWKGDVEVSGEGWRADVLVTQLPNFNNNELFQEIDGNLIPTYQESDKPKQIIFEIQLSPQSLEETQYRQERYRKAGLECVWLFKSLPTGSAIANLPMFKVQIITNNNEVKYHVEVEDYRFTLEDFIKAWLEGYIHYCHHLQSKTAIELEIYFFPINCHKCLTINYLYGVEAPTSIYVNNTISLKSGCGVDLVRPNRTKEKTRLEFRPEVISRIQSFIINQGAWDSLLANIQYNSTHKWWHWSCYHCQEPIIHPNYYLKRDNLLTDNDNILSKNLETVIYFSQPILSREQSHWCYSRTQQFCNQKVSFPEPQQAIIWQEEIGNYYKSPIKLVQKKPQLSESESTFTQHQLEELSARIKRIEKKENTESLPANSSGTREINTWSSFRVNDIPEEHQNLWNSILIKIPQKYQGLFYHHVRLKEFNAQEMILDVSKDFGEDLFSEYMDFFLKACHEIFTNLSFHIFLVKEHTSELLWTSDLAKKGGKADITLIKQTSSYLPKNQIWQECLKNMTPLSLKYLLEQHAELVELSQTTAKIRMSSTPLLEKAQKYRRNIKSVLEQIMDKEIDLILVR